MNTGFLGPAVATVPTVYGIETHFHFLLNRQRYYGQLQQYLPFTVLKLLNEVHNRTYIRRCNSTYRLRY